MKIKFNNKTIEVKVCKSIFSKIKGLMFSRKKNLLFIFDKDINTSFHMFFVFYPVYLILLDNNKKVIENKILYPFTIYFPKNKFRYALELTSNYNINSGVKLNF